MKKLIILIPVFFLTTGNAILAQDLPVNCENRTTPFSEIMKGKITSQVRNAHHYFMNSPDPAAGQTYEQRTTNLNNAVVKTFQEFMRIRKEEYGKTICKYHKEDWNKPGNSSWRTLTCQPGFYFLGNTITHTTNGDMKAGPNISSNKITWKTGGHGSSKTFVEIQAKYDKNYIEKIILDELNTVRKELNDLGIPTEVPPFLD